VSPVQLSSDLGIKCKVSSLPLMFGSAPLRSALRLIVGLGKSFPQKEEADKKLLYIKADKRSTKVHLLRQLLDGSL